MEHEFEILVAAVLANEASPSDQARLQDLLRQDPARRQEFDALAATARLLGRAGTLLGVGDAPPAPIAEPRMRALLDAARAAGSAAERPSSRPLWLVAACLAALAVVTGLVLSLRGPGPPPAPGTPPFAYLLTPRGQLEIWRSGKVFPAGAVASLQPEDQVRLLEGAQATLILSNGVTTITGPLRLEARDLAARDLAAASNGPAVLPLDRLIREALFQPVGELPGSGLLVTLRGTHFIPLYSPAGVTASLTPAFFWKAETGKTYELVLTDEFNPNTPAWRLDAAVPPVQFDQVPAWAGRALARDGLYRLRLAETGRPLTACEFTFRTTSAAGEPRSSSPAGRLSDAFRLLSASPGRVGDALAELLSLPPELERSELSLRLKLVAFGRLGYGADFDAVSTQLLEPR